MTISLASLVAFLTLLLSLLAGAMGGGGTPPPRPTPTATATATPTSTPFTPDGRPGQEALLHPGERAVFESDGERLEVLFVGVTADSRCPVDVTCIWAGEARVALDFVGLMSWEGTLSGDRGASVIVAGWIVTVTDLTPVPRSDRPIAPGDYEARIVVTR
jgi:hypothetical protein